MGEYRLSGQARSTRDTTEAGCFVANVRCVHRSPRLRVAHVSNRTSANWGSSEGPRASRTCGKDRSMGTAWSVGAPERRARLGKAAGLPVSMGEGGSRGLASPVGGERRRGWAGVWVAIHAGRLSTGRVKLAVAAAEP